jgi:hypothetical protein
MIDIFEPIHLANGLDYPRSVRLLSQAGEYGVRIVVRWVDRGRLVTSHIESLTSPIDGPAVFDFDALTLDLAPSSKASEYVDLIKKFTTELQQRTLNANQGFERTSDIRFKIHLLQPYRSIAACGRRGPWLGSGKASLTCMDCIRIAFGHVNRTPHSLESFEFRESELKCLADADESPSNSANTELSSEIEKSKN